MRVDLDQVKQQCDALDVEVNGLEEEVGRLEDDNKTLTTSNEQMQEWTFGQATIRTATNILNASKIEILQLKADLYAHHSKQIEMLAANVDELHKSAQELWEQKSCHFNNLLKSMRRQRNEARGERDKAYDERDEARGEVHEYVDRLKKKTADMENLKKRIEILAKCHYRMVYDTYCCLYNEDKVDSSVCGSSEWHMKSPTRDLVDQTDRNLINIQNAMSRIRQRLDKSQNWTLTLVRIAGERLERQLIVT